MPKRKRYSRSHHKGRSQRAIIFLALAFIIAAIALTLAQTARDLSFFERLFAWLAARSGARRAQEIVLSSWLILTLGAAGLLFLLIALVRTVRR